MHRAIAYIRVSSDEQGQSGFGLQAQEADIKGFAQVAGYKVMKIYREVGSAIGGDSLRKRSELREAIRQAEKHGWPVIVTQLDRVSRVARELEDLVLKSNIRFISTRDGANSDPVVVGRQAARIAAETKMLKERTRRGIERAKQQGKVFGNRKNLAEAQRKGARSNKETARKRRLELEPVIKEMRSRGYQSGAEISAQLNKQGMRTARGQEWTEANLRRVLRRIDKAAAAPKRAEDVHLSNPKWGLF